MPPLANYAEVNVARFRIKVVERDEEEGRQGLGCDAQPRSEDTAGLGCDNPTCDNCITYRDEVVAPERNPAGAHDQALSPLSD
jgi:hypothetical protein